MFRNNNKDEDNSPKTLNDENLQASSQKFRQLMVVIVFQNRGSGFMPFKNTLVQSEHKQNSNLVC